MLEPDTERIFGALNEAGHTIRFVGGCIRILSQVDLSLISIWQPMLPERVSGVLSAARFGLFQLALIMARLRVRARGHSKSRHYGKMLQPTGDVLRWNLLMIGMKTARRVLLLMRFQLVTAEFMIILMV